MRTGVTVDAFRNELLTQNWEEVYKEIMLIELISLYNKTCPVKEVSKKQKYIDKP